MPDKKFRILAPTSMKNAKLPAENFNNPADILPIASLNDAAFSVLTSSAIDARVMTFCFVVSVQSVPPANLATASPAPAMAEPTPNAARPPAIVARALTPLIHFQMVLLILLKEL